MSFRPFRRLPPWTFGSRDRADQLVCDPRSYVRAWQADGRPLWAPCLAWSPGPAELAVTGDGSFQTLFGAAWLLQICDDGSWVLYQRQGNEDLTVIPWDVTPPFASLSARHPSLAFDQAARPAIAWEDDAGIRLREFNELTGQYAFIGPFAGVDPVLLNDATVNYHVAGSDVVLYYLDAGRETLMYRIQSENFLTEHAHHTYADPPVILDASDIGGYRFQLRHSDGTGAVIPSGSTFEALLSDVYPIYLREELAATIASLEDGEYQLVVMTRGAITEPLAATVGTLGDGVLLNVILQRDEILEAVTATVGALGDGALVNVVLQRAEVAEGVTGAVGSLADGVLFFVILSRDGLTDGFTAAVGSLGDGAYAAA